MSEHSHVIDGCGDGMPKLLFVVTEDWYFLSHRIPMARAAQSTGFEVHVACRDSGHVDRIVALGFQVHPLRWLVRGPVRPASELLAVIELHRLISELTPDVLQLVAIKPVVLGLMAGALRSSPTLCTFAGLGSSLAPGQEGTPTARAIRAVIRTGARRNSVHAIVQNADDLAQVTSRFGFPSERVHLVEGSGIDTSTVGRMTRPSEPRMRFVFAGRLLADKGLRELFQAFADVRSTVPHAELLVIGDRDTTNPTSLTPSEVTAAGSQPGVTFTGRLSQGETQALVEKSDVAVLPSYREGLPRFLLEAGAAGLALIAADVPGCRSVVVHGKTGLLVPPRDPASLSQAMLTLANDPHLRERLGSEASAVVRHRFDSEVVQTAMRLIYVDVLGGERS